MATTTYPHYRRHPGAEAHGARDALARARAALPLAGRLLFTLLFFVSVPGHFDDSGVAYAASQGVPVPEVLVPLSGVLLLVGSASIALGFHARIGALLLMAFLVPVTFFMHRFWEIPDPTAARMQYISFLKNVSLFGATLFIAYFGSGPFSVDRTTRHSR